MSSKHTPVSAKVIYYGADGTGRDSYIKTINGGLLTQDQLHSLIPIKIEQVDRMQFQKKKYHRTEPPLFNPKIPNYESDGSGRDRYICVNNGGCADVSHHWRNHVDEKFKSSLRQYQIVPHSFQRDQWQNLQQGFRNQRNNSRQLSTEKTQAQQQMNLTTRLFSAKKGRSNSYCSKPPSNNASSLADRSVYF